MVDLQGKQMSYSIWWPRSRSRWNTSGQTHVCTHRHINLLIHLHECVPEKYKLHFRVNFRHTEGDTTASQTSLCKGLSHEPQHMPHAVKQILIYCERNALTSLTPVYPATKEAIVHNVQLTNINDWGLGNYKLFSLIFFIIDSHLSPPYFFFPLELFSFLPSTLSPSPWAILVLRMRRGEWRSVWGVFTPSRQRWANNMVMWRHLSCLRQAAYHTCLQRIRNPTHTSTATESKDFGQVIFTCQRTQHRDYIHFKTDRSENDKASMV